MLERTGLLIGPGQYQFAHKSIGEFLVAEAIVTEQVRIDDTLFDRLYLLKHAAIDFWRVVLFLWAGLVPSKLDLIEFCDLLIMKGQIGVVLGLVTEFFEELLSDHPARTAELISSALLVPERDCVDLGMSAISRSTFLERLHPRVPGSLVLQRHRYLSITGEDSFGEPSFSSKEMGALLPVAQWRSVQGDSTFYFDLWTCWVMHGAELDLLIEKRPRKMTECQAFLYSSAVRRLIMEPSAEDPSFNPIFYIPLIVNEVLEYLLGSNAFLRGGDDEDGRHFGRVKMFMEQHPVSEWSDFWFKTLLTKPAARELSERIPAARIRWTSYCRFADYTISSQRGSG